MITANIAFAGVVTWFFFLLFVPLYSNANIVPGKYSPWCTSFYKRVTCKIKDRIFTASINVCRFEKFQCKNCIPASALSKNFTQICSLDKRLTDPLHLNLRHHTPYEEKPSWITKEKPKQIVKRQTKGPDICGNIPSPKPGKVSCRVTPNTITCEGTCNAGYKFRDGSSKMTHFCTDLDGLWKPQKNFLPCDPQCELNCQNGGICEGVNICSCSNEYRGDACQYSITLCSLLKTERPSSWQCNHSRLNSTCDIACYPPDSFEAEVNSHTYSCSLHGLWTPPLPPCVISNVVGCPNPGPLENGQLEALATEVYSPSSRISFVCDKGFVLLGNADLNCGVNGIWNGDKPICSKTSAGPDSCPPLAAPHNAEIYRVFSDSQLKTDSLLETVLPSSNVGILKSKFPPGSKIQYRCLSKFYKLYGSEYQTCLPSGIWSGNRPTCVPVCGKSDLPRTPFIIHGRSTAVGQWPWQVGISLWMKEVKQWHLICGGTLIAERWVLTAAHCVTKEHSSTPLDRQSVSVHCGKYYRSFEKDDNYVQTKKILQIIIHENYDFIRYDADIALLQLESPVELTSRVQTICLPTDDTTRENIRDGKDGVVIGWGKNENGLYSEVLRESELPVVSHSRCEESYRAGHRSITVTGNMFCAGHEDGRTDTCNGDSGGPMLFLDGAQRPPIWTLEGIVSWGSGAGCGKERQYSGFTKVRNFVDWINMFI